MRTSLFGILFLLTLIGFSQPSKGEETNYFLAEYQQGSSWNDAVSYEQQSDIAAHLAFLKRSFEDGKLLMSGEVVDANGLYILLQANSLSSAKAFLQHDPLIVNGVFELTVSGWLVNRSLLRANRKVAEPLDPSEPFTLERLDPSSPLNLPES